MHKLYIFQTFFKLCHESKTISKIVKVVSLYILTQANKSIEISLLK